MHLRSCHRRVEDAGHPQVRARPDAMVLMAVEQVHGAVTQWMHVARLVVDELALSADAIDGLDVVGVPHRGLGTGVEDGVVEGESHLLTSQDEPAAPPGRCAYVAVGVVDVLEGTDDHAGSSLL